MKMVRYLLMALLIAFVPVVEARLKSKSVHSLEKINFEWWPRETFQGAQNNISLTVRALSEEEASDLFLGKGKRFLEMICECGRPKKRSEPIVPLYIKIENNNSFPIAVGQENISSGKNRLDKIVPINLANILESLNHQSWSSPVTYESSLVYDAQGKFAGTTGNYKVNNNPLLDCAFLMLDTFSLSHLSNLESSIFYNNSITCGSVLIEEGATKEVLLFVWGKEITPKFSITIVKNTFNVDLFTSLSDIKNS